MVSARVFVLAPLVLLGGCRSAFVNATVHNASGQSVSLIEIDYPSASFGVQTLAPAADLHYRFKILGSGPVKIMYTDAQNHEHTSLGPTLHEGLAGTLEVTISPSAVSWSQQLKER